MSGPPAGDVVLGAVGAVLVLIALGDLFLTIFNYDGFSSLANHLHRWLWRAIRNLARPLPTRLRHNALSIGSASMLPATYILWLGLEVIGFGLMYEAMLQARPPGFVLDGVGRDLGSALYLSAGAISSLTFGDVVPRTGLTRALVDLETIIGLTTFTLALGYVVTTFDVLKTLDGLHSLVRRHAEDPGKPSSILARHFRGGQPTELPSLPESVTDRLEQYDEGSAPLSGRLLLSHAAARPLDPARVREPWTARRAVALGAARQGADDAGSAPGRAHRPVRHDRRSAAAKLRRTPRPGSSRPAQRK